MLFERVAIRDWRAVTALFMTSTLLESLAMGHMGAFTPLFLGDALHLPRHEIGPWTGLLTAATFAVGFPLAPLWASLAERYTHKLLIVRCQYIQAVAYTVCGLAPDLGWFLGARLLLGLALGNIALVIATQSLLTPDRRIGSAIGVVQVANPIAVSFGPPLGALALPWLGLRGLFIADAVGCLLAGVLITLLMPEPAPRNRQRSVVANVRKSVGIVWRRPVLRWNFVTWYLTRGATNVVDTYLPVRIGELTTDPAPVIGTVMGVYGALTTFGTWWAGRLADRFGAARLVWPAMFIAAVSTTGVGLAPTLWLVTAFAWVRSIPVVLTNIALYAQLAQILNREERAPVLSLTPVPRNLAQFTLPLVAAVAANIATTGAFVVAAAAYGVAAWIGRLLLAETEREPPGNV